MTPGLQRFACKEDDPHAIVLDRLRLQGHDALRRLQDLTTVWGRAILEPGSEHRRLSQLCPALRELYDHPDRRPRPILARTLRMLLFYEALLTSSSGKRLYNPYWKTVGKLRDRVPELDTAVTTVLQAKIVRRDCEYSLALLLLQAIAYSQCQQFHPILWEAQSAARAMDELNAMKVMDLPEFKYLRDVIVLFVRCQCGPGQLARGSGSRKYQDRVAELANPGPEKQSQERQEFFTRRELDAAMCILGLVEEARNRQVPSSGTTERPTTPSDGELDLNAGVTQGWDKVTCWLLRPEMVGDDRPGLKQLCGQVFRDQDSLRQKLQEKLGKRADSDEAVIEELVENAGMDAAGLAWELINPIVAPPRHTWAYAAWMPQAEVFKQLFEEHWAEMRFQDTDQQVRWDVSSGGQTCRIAAFAMDRRLMEKPLRDVLTEQIAVVVGPEDRSSEHRLTECRRRFAVKAIKIPDVLGAEPEYVLEVRLDDFISAHHLLFPVKKSDPEPEPIEEPGDAASLWRYLYDQAIEIHQLRNDALEAQGEGQYFPVPLMKRMLDIAYRLRSHSCLSVSITLLQGNEEHEHSIYFPDGLRPEENELVENYVAVYIHNQAMAKGLRGCKLSFHGLDTAGDSGPGRTRTGAAHSDWPKRILQTLIARGYDDYVEQYLRDFNTDGYYLQAVYYPQCSIPKIAIAQLSDMLGSFPALGGAGEKRRGPSGRLFLGIDIGATFTKYQFYRFGKDGFEPVGKPFKELTPDPSKDQVPKEQQTIEHAVNRFTRKVLETINRRIAADPELCSLVNDGDSPVIALGISWPGAVRSNRVAATSNVLSRFYIPPWEAPGRIDCILRLKLVESMRNSWKRELHRLREEARMPSFAMLNDGDAEGTGVLMHHLQSDALQEGELVVVKIGTGTAGAVFKQGRLDGGLNEWGKMILDLGRKPRRAYPAGMASQYLRSKTWPDLVQADQLRLSDPNQRLFLDCAGLDSIELGRLLETKGSVDERPAMEALRRECGIIALAQSLGGPLNAEMVRRAMELERHEESAESELVFIIQTRLNELGMTDAKKKLEDDSQTHGGIRLSQMLRVRGEELKDYFANPNQSVSSDLQKALQQGYEIADRTCAIMGRYLGDFIAMLYDIYGMDVVITSGGVLSGNTGDRVRDEAVERLKAYSLWFDCAKNKRIFTRNPEGPGDAASQRVDGSVPTSSAEPTDTVAGSSEVDYGTLGAVVYAASECLFELKLQGLNEIRSRFQRLRPTETVELRKDTIDFPDSKVTLQQSSLTFDEVELYLAQEGERMGYHRMNFYAPDDPQRIASYVRFVAK